jgi:predicted  nucleic acid-binding Zn-ribbon protein
MDSSNLMTIVGSVLTVATAIAAVQKVLKNIQKSREEHNAKILQAAKEEISAAKRKLEGRIIALELDVEHLRDSVSKDLVRAQESYSEALKSVEEKIKDARQELRDHHSQILQLLSALIDSRE